jgi:Ca2+-binding EF-hand superfamily protein
MVSSFRIVRSNSVTVPIMLAGLLGLSGLVLSETNQAGRSNSPASKVSMAAIFKVADSNRDEQLSMEELDSYVIDSFAKQDHDQNGFLDRKEAQGGEASFRESDSNKDGKIALRELMVIAHQNFKLADSNSDHVLSRAEAFSFK